MSSFESKAWTLARAAAVCAALAILPGCASFYLDSTIQELKPEEKVTIANPQPVQLLFEFQTKGAPNGQGTDLTKAFVSQTVQSSGLFSQVSADPAPNGALLHITLNNIPLTDNPVGKGFATGVTFGIVGNTVGDGYVCTLTYQARPNAADITKTVQNAIYASLGSAGPPPHAEQMPLDKALEAMTRRTIAVALNELAKDPAFHQ